MSLKHILTATIFSLAFPVAAQQPSVTVKPFGAMFLEAPPGRDKNLVPMGGFGAQEKVEIHAIATFTNKVIVNSPLFRGDSKVKATAVLVDKTTMDLGSADISSFRKTSDDGKRTLLSISIARLPDKPISAVNFNGAVNIQVASGTSRKTINFEPKVGNRIDAGLGAITVSVVEANSFTLSGSDQLDRIAGVKILKADGTTMVGERGGHSRIGDSDKTIVQTQWSFKSSISAGKLEVSIYDGLETIDVPIKLSVNKSY
jgi:hypothetical protein